MTKAEFLEILENKLTGEVDAEKVRRNLQYYNSYIDAAIRDGKTESQVLEELGSPLLIARTIIDTSGGNESAEPMRPGRNRSSGTITAVSTWK